MNLKWIIGGQVNPIISIIIDDNNNNKITITTKTTITITITIIKISKHSTEQFSVPISQVRVEKSVHLKHIKAWLNFGSRPHAKIKLCFFYATHFNS